MNLFGAGWEGLLSDYFDHKVTFYSPKKIQDSTGQQTDDFEIVSTLTDVPCAIGNKMLSRTSNMQSSYGSQEPRTVILIANAHPEIKVGWKAIVDGSSDEPYLVQERTPNQSADVSEVPVRRWH